MTVLNIEISKTLLFTGRPCLSALQHTKKGLLGAYIPQCDRDGFYTSTQCHGSSGTCWCVDKNGVEFTNTRRKGKPDCGNVNFKHLLSSFYAMRISLQKGY